MHFQDWKQEMFDITFKEMQMARINDEFITYSDFGEGKPILLFHGSFGGFDCGPLFFSKVAERGYRIITPSRPGFMMTPLEMGQSVEEQADFFAAFIDFLKIDKVIIMAHSGGTPAALQFAYKYPEKTSCICALTPVGHAFKFGSHPVINRLIFNDFVMYFSHVFSKIAPRFHAYLLCKSINVNPAYILESEERMKNLQITFGTSAPTKFRYAGLKNDLENFKELNLSFLKEIKNRVQLLYSVTDKRVPITHGQYLEKMLPNVQVYKFARGGHNPIQGSHSKLIVDMICAFIETCPAGSIKE